ncbi:MAG: hypothetical protein ABUJ98_15745 [Hyphomicrobium sp.]
MSAYVRDYQLGDLHRVKSKHSPQMDREFVEEHIEKSLSRTICEEGTDAVLASFGIWIDEGAGIGLVWIDFSPDAQQRYPLFLARTIRRHIKIAESRWNLERIVTLIAEDDPRSIRWINWLGFKPVTPEDWGEIPEGQIVYARAC